MKINLKKLGEQAIETTTEQTKMRLSEDASSMVFQLFTKNVYSNPIGTVVREITSNCFDSHVEAKENDPNWQEAPVVIRKHKDEQSGTHYISFIDYGVGMSPERVKNIYGVYFESTKRVTNEQIGGFGIGGKTPLAYKRSTGQGEGEYDNSFFVITNYDGTKYFYCIYEGAESPVISELHKEPTTDRNGTEIQIPVLEKDLKTFESEMTRQLYYFENIVFEGFEYPHAYNTDENNNPVIVKPLDNDYQIVRGKNFLFRGDKYSSNVHVCLGRVAYPIDYDVLDLSSSDYSLPIALKLEVGDIGVTVSRESLDYSESTIKFLKKKLEAAKQEIADLIGKQYKNIKTLEQYFTVKHDFGKLEFPNGTSLYVGDLIKQKDVDFTNFKYSFMKMPNDKQLFKFFFEATMYGKKPRKSRYSYNDDSTEFTGGYEAIKTKNNLVYVNGEFNRKVVKQAWLKDTYTTYFIIKKREIANDWMRKEIADLFNVNVDNIRDDHGNVVPFVQSLIEMQEEYFGIVQKHCNDYDTLQIPDTFVQSRKRGAGVTPELRKTTIPVKFIDGYSKDRVKLSVLFDYNMPIFYGTTDDEWQLKKAVRLYKLLFHRRSTVVTHCDYNDVLQTTNRGYYSRHDDDNQSKRSIVFMQIAQGNVKHMQHCKNAKHVNEFFKTMLPRKAKMVTEYFQTYELVEKYKNLEHFYRNGFINRVDKTWGKKADAVKKLIDAIPEKHKDDNIRYQKDSLREFFKVDDIKKTKQQEQVIDRIAELEELQEKNTEILNFFNLPREADSLTDEQITILQVSMSL